MIYKMKRHCQDEGRGNIMIFVTTIQQDCRTWLVRTKP
jgi:hypothetical protein